MLGHTKIRKPSTSRFWSKNFKVQSGSYQSPLRYSPPNLLTPNQATAGDALGNTVGIQTPHDVWGTFNNPESIITYTGGNLTITAPAINDVAEAVLVYEGGQAGLNYTFNVTGYVASGQYKYLYIEFYSGPLEADYLDGFYTDSLTGDDHSISMVAPIDTTRVILWFSASYVLGTSSFTYQTASLTAE